jgi:kynurenine 3-monooxygenase
MSDAIFEFSELRTKDIETLVKVSASLDKPGFMGLFTFLIPIIMDGIFHKLAPRIFAQNVIAMLQREDMTFQEVVERKRKDRAAQLVSVGLLFAVVTIVSDTLNELVVS